MSYYSYLPLAFSVGQAPCAENARTHSEGGKALIAGEENASAEAAMQEMLRSKPEWTVERERQFLVFKEEKDESHWLGGLRRAGLPER